MTEQRVDYQKYIKSEAWKRKRTERLEIDNHKCVVCKHDGSIYPLSVHHIHYETLGDEDPVRDLITVCGPCHDLFTDAMTRKRYGERRHETDAIESLVQERKPNGVANSTLQIDLRRSNVDAQRADCQPRQQVGQGDETDQWQAQEDRRRL